MLLWFDKDNPAYLKVVYDIETSKSDLVKLKLDLSRAIDRRQAATSSAELIEENLEYINKWAKVVNMKEYTRLKHMLAAEYEVIRSDRNLIPFLEKQIKIVETNIQAMELNLPALRSKVLEFKPRE